MATQGKVQLQSLAKIPKFPVGKVQKIKKVKNAEMRKTHHSFWVKGNGEFFVLRKDKYKDREICEVFHNLLK